MSNNKMNVWEFLDNNMLFIVIIAFFVCASIVNC